MRIRLVSPLNKKLVRDLWGAKGQVIAIASVIATGIMSFTALHGAFQDLTLTRDAYMRKYRMADLFFMLERAPASVVDKIKRVPGVLDARGRIVKEVTLDIEGRLDPAVGRVVSIPDEDGRFINGIHVSDGRYPGPPGSNTVLLSEEFAQANGFTPGSKLKALINDRKHDLLVCGSALSPEYIYVIRGIQELMPNAKAFGIIWAGRKYVEESFGFQNAINDVVVTIEDQSKEKELLERIGSILEPYGLAYKHGKMDQLSYRSLNDELTGLNAQATVVPTIFIAVASVILFIIVGRFVKRQREQVGVMKAFGYGNGQVLLHFTGHSLAIGIVGTVAGLALGDWMARLMVKMYQGFFRFPLLEHSIRPDVFAWAALFGLAGPVVAGILAARKTLAIQPAVALRPESPAVYSGGRWWKSMGRLWKLMPFTWKIVLRNLLRHKGRSAFVMLGVGLSTAILVMGLFMMDSMTHLIYFQYEVVNRQDAKILLQREQGMDAVRAAKRLPGVVRAEPLLEIPLEARNGDVKKDILVVGIPRGAEMIQVRDTSYNRVEIPESGIVLPEVTARSLKARAGDSLTVKPLYPGFRERKVIVARVVPQYLGQTAYMDLKTASRLIGEGAAMNGVLLEIDSAREDELIKAAKDTPRVATIELRSRMLEMFRKMFIDFMWIAIMFYVFFSGVIGFAVIYTSAALSIGERARELATLKVLGVRHSEVASVIFGEYLVLSLAGIAAGMPVGLGFTALFARAFQSELYTIPVIFEPASAFKAGAIVIVFLLLARMACERPLRKLDMVATLKRGD